MTRTDVVQATTGRYLAAIDDALPGFVEMLFVTGSAALGAFEPGASDIDTMIVTARPPGPADLAAMAEVHAAMPRRPHFDGVYLDRDTFRRQPADQRPTPFVVNGEFRADQPCGELHPVLWLLLSRYGRTVRGPAVADLGLTVDATALRRYNLDNLKTYWAHLAAEGRRTLATMPAEAAVDAEPVAWAVLGPARLHFTLAHEDIVSKAGAGEYLADHFPRYACLADRAVRSRRGEQVAFTVADGRAGADSIDAVIEDAWRRWGHLC
ncbi:nucleotidyltransferase domain-containing protein [Actinoplanes sp. NEAU-A12]|uniref:Nucleotidyltransferase domain-containing protein n=1 Tax=Actinoplanes sandaracinus TaxID=3045177 RepID=A0ABT6WKI2_9ACTN|nr:nucleotidyltransferase domain-containing protein [Actinoplanes sandaracinus]MDI6100242.1 nucleotidyltransferase domain-containing protein [Actinoplanes sandaracinus]